MELGLHLKRLREAKGLSQDDLAQKIFVSRQTISNWETNKTYPDIESLMLLSALFDISIDDLIKGDLDTMKKTIEQDYKKILFRGNLGFLIAIMGVIMAIVGFSYFDWGAAPSIIIGALIWGIGMSFVIQSEKIKKKHDLVTFKEIIAFSEGRVIDRSNPKSQQARQHRILKIVIALVIGAIAGGILGWHIPSIFG